MSERYTISVDPASGDSKGAWVLTQWKDDESITVLATGEGEPPFVARVTSEAVMATRLYRELASQSTLSEEDTIILAALQQGGLAAAEWLAAEIARLSGRFVNSEAASMTLEDELALRATAAPTLTPGYWLAAALSATGQEAPTDGEILDALGGGMKCSYATQERAR